MVLELRRPLTTDFADGSCLQDTEPTRLLPGHVADLTVGFSLTVARTSNARREVAKCCVLQGFVASLCLETVGAVRGLLQRCVWLSKVMKSG